MPPVSAPGVGRKRHDQRKIMSLNQKIYRYKQKWWLGPACAILFGLCAWMFWIKAHEPPRGLMIKHMIELSPGEAQVFHWALFAVSMLLVALGVLVFLTSFKSERYITISATSIRAPKSGISSLEVDVPFDSIKSLQLQEVQRQRFLHINHAGGKLSIVQSMLSSKAEFEEICALVSARVPRAAGR